MTFDSNNNTLILVFSLLVLTGCLSDPGPTADTGPEADPLTPVMTDCGPLDNPEDPTFTYVCSWKVNEDHGTYLAIELLVDERTRINVSHDRSGTWKNSVGFYQMRTLGVTSGEGFVNNVRSSGSVNTCSSESKSLAECDLEEFVEPRVGGFGTEIDPGKYLLLYAAFGADRWSLDLDIQFENPVQTGKVAGGSTDLVWVEWSDSGPRQERSTNWEHESDQPFWAVVRHSGDVLLEDLTIDLAEGGERHWEKSPDFPGWTLPEQWDEDFGGSPNIAGTRGTWDFQMTGIQEEDGRLGVPIMGIAEDPFFVDPVDGLKDYGS